MAYDELQDMGKATDKPKGFVKWSLIGYWSAILGLCGFIAGLFVKIDKKNTECNDKVERIMTTMQTTIDQIRVDYNNKLENRLDRLENVEEKADKVLLKQKEAQK